MTMNLEQALSKIAELETKLLRYERIELSVTEQEKREDRLQAILNLLFPEDPESLRHPEIYAASAVLEDDDGDQDGTTQVYVTLDQRFGDMGQELTFPTSWVICAEEDLELLVKTWIRQEDSRLKLEAEDKARAQKTAAIEAAMKLLKEEGLM